MDPGTWFSNKLVGYLPIVLPVVFTRQIVFFPVTCQKHFWCSPQPRTLFRVLAAFWQTTLTWPAFLTSAKYSATTWAIVCHRVCSLAARKKKKVEFNNLVINFSSTFFSFFSCCYNPWPVILYLDFRPLTKPELTHFGWRLLRVPLYACKLFNQITLYGCFSAYTVQ